MPVFSSQIGPVFDFYAGPSARGRQLYCRACNFKNVSALLAGNFYTSYIDPNRLPLLGILAQQDFTQKI